MKTVSRSASPAPDTTTAANGRVARLVALWHEAKDQAIAGEAIYVTLREAILSGVLLPGERLGEEYWPGSSSAAARRCAKRSCGWRRRA